MTGSGGFASPPQIPQPIPVSSHMWSGFAGLAGFFEDSDRNFAIYYNRGGAHVGAS